MENKKEDKWEKMTAMGEKREQKQPGKEMQMAEAADSWMRLEMDSRSANEEFARVTAAVFMSRMNPTLEEMEDVKTAVSEAVTNAVIHGYGEKIGIIYIEAQIEGTQLTIAIEDRGVGIADIKKAMEPMYTGDPSGERSGMGFSFMEAFMDEVKVESELGHGTRVTMKKKIGSAAQRAETENLDETEPFYG